MSQLAIVAVLLALGQAEDFDGPSGGVVSNLIETIQNRRFQRVGVIPRFLVRQGNRETAGGSIGPEADFMAEQLEAGLAQASKGKFKVVDGRRMRLAFKSLKIDDLGNPQSLKRVAEEVGGLDALVICVVTDSRSRPSEEGLPLTIQARLVEVTDCSLAGASREDAFISLGDAAYMGESWELRRWYGNRLRIVGLRSLGAPQKYADQQFFDRLLDSHNYRSIRRDLPHPLLDANCPYRMAVVVNGQERPLVRLGKKVYVELDPGDTYWVRIENKIARPAYFSLFVDGVNILGKKRETPDTARYWHLNPNYTSNLKGWYTLQTGSNYKVEEFTIAPADDTVAAGQGFGQQLGLISAVFWTVGMDNIPRPDSYPTAMAGAQGSFGTGAGRASEVRLEGQQGPEPGLTLAAMTIYYATAPQLEELRKASAE